MSHQPFRVVRPLAQIFDISLLQRIREVKESMSAGDVECLGPYSYYDHVQHGELCVTLQRRLAELRRSDNAVLSSSRLFLPLHTVRRSIAAVQRFPNTTADLERQKRVTEAAIIDDVLRLSTDDLTARDGSSLWSIALQVSRWESVEKLLDRFPMTTIMQLMDDREYRDLIIWVCSSIQATPHSDDGGGVRSGAGEGTHGSFSHAARLLGSTIDAGEAMAKCKALLLGTGAASADGPEAESAAYERSASLITCAHLTAALNSRCGLKVDFPLSEAEWHHAFGPAPSPSAAPVQLHGSDAAVSGTARVAATRSSITSGYLAGWCRRLTTVHDPSVPAFVQSVMAPAFTRDLEQLYRHREVMNTALFFLVVLPAMEKQQVSVVDVRQLVRTQHNAVMGTMFWTHSAASSSSASSASSSASPSAAGTAPGKRGKWTARPLAQSDSAATTSSTFALSAESALTILLAEVTLMNDGEAVVAEHEAAIATLLRTVLAFLRPYMKRSADGVDASLWLTWHPVQSGYLALVISRLMRATSSNSASDDKCGVQAVPSNPVLGNLIAESLTMLRRLLDLSLIEERGTASLVTVLLLHCQEVTLAVGGKAFVARLRALVVAHAMDGFARADLAQMAEVAQRRSAQESEAEREETREFVRQLEAAQLQLPLRKWYVNI